MDIETGIIRGVSISGKFTRGVKGKQVIRFELERAANRSKIRDLIERVWEVKVCRVNTVKCGPKSGRSSRHIFSRPARRFAVVVLKEGYKIDLPGGVDQVQAQQAAS